MGIFVFSACLQMSEGLIFCRSGRPFLGEQDVLAIHHHLITLVQYFTRLDYASMALLLGVFLFVFHGDTGTQGVPYEHRFWKAQLVITVGKRDRIDLARCQTNPDGEGHRTVGDPLAEWSLTRKLRIHVMGEVISSVPGVDHYVSFCNRATGCHSMLAHNIVFPILDSGHHGNTPGLSVNLFPPIAEDSVWLATARVSFTCGGPTLSPMRGRKGTAIAAIASPCSFKIGKLMFTTPCT